jgi:hypothetical protein
MTGTPPMGGHDEPLQQAALRSLTRDPTAA